MNMPSGNERDFFVQVRVTEEERNMFRRLAATYGMDLSTFVRSVMAHINETRPTLKVPPGPEAAPLSLRGKDPAPAVHVAAELA